MNIKKALREHGYTLTAVSEKLGITQSALSQQINNRSITVAKLEEISRLIDVPLQELVSPGGGVKCRCPHCGKPIKVKIEAGE